MIKISWVAMIEGLVKDICKEIKAWLFRKTPY